MVENSVLLTLDESYLSLEKSKWQKFALWKQINRKFIFRTGFFFKIGSDLWDIAQRLIVIGIFYKLPQ